MTARAGLRLGRGARAAAALCCLLAAARAGSGRAAPTAQAAPAAPATPAAPAPPPGLEYVPPPPGSYALPPIQPAVDGAVIDADGTRRRLFDYLGDRFVVLSFVYTHCSDSEGCPLATGILEMVQEEIGAKPGLSERVRLVTLSFDPERDTPEAMRRYALHAGGDYLRTRWNARRWVFLTTASRFDLRPILEGYGQSVVPEVDRTGRRTGDFSHVLKVFLIDRRRRVRNIYSTRFLHPALLIDDLETLALERASAPGDVDARALRRIRNPPLGLPPVPVPAADPPSIAKIRLGRKLFLDRRLSRNGSLSCAMCHVPEQGFTVNEIRTAVGFEGRSLRRNAPTLLNTAYAGPHFHDGREPDLELQPFDVLTNPDEMAAPSLGAVVATVRALPEYAPLFERAFRAPAGVTTIGQAIATYLRTLLSARSPFDRWRFGKEEGALGEDAQRGFDLFTGKGRCATCHTIGADHALFTDHRFHDTGVAWFEATVRRASAGPVALRLAPGVETDLQRSVVQSVGDAPANDLGRYEVTGDPADRWRIKTPTLRNVALTAPYMHDGSFSTLREVVAFYDRGAYPHDGLDPALRPLGLDAREIDDLVAFLASLTGDDVGELIRDARSEEVGNPGESGAGRP